MPEEDFLVLMTVFTVTNILLIGLVTFGNSYFSLCSQATSPARIVVSSPAGNKTNCFLFVLILSSIQGWDWRNVLRETWVSDLQMTVGVMYKFANWNC